MSTSAPKLPAPANGTPAAGGVPAALLRAFVCPITTEIMVDPVICPEGHSFERTAVEAWLRTHQTNPVTRNPLSAAQLSPNRALKESIAQFLAASGGASAAASMVAAATGVAETQAAAAAARASGTAGTGPPKLPGAGGMGDSFAPAAGAPLVQLRVFDPAPDSLQLPGAPRPRAGFRRKLVRVDIIPPDPPLASGRTPCDVVCVVDTSGSMCSAAKAKDADGNEEDTGLSVLDVTKHAVSTVVAVLNAADRFALVSYSNSAKVECGLTPMTASGRARAKHALGKLQPSGSTNLWDGLQKAFDTLRAAAADREGPPRHQAILLLTDGCPNIVPPRGHLPTMRRYLDKHPLDCCVHTFGFGYSLDSMLLAELAEEGNGQYAFIPDAGLVGTVFVNALSNILTTQAKNVKVQLEIDLAPSAAATTHGGAAAAAVDEEAGKPLQQAVLVPDALVGLNRTQQTSWGLEVQLGALNYGQPRSMAVHVDVPVDAATRGLTVGGVVRLQFVQAGSGGAQPAVPAGTAVPAVGSTAGGGASASVSTLALGELSLDADDGGALPAGAAAADPTVLARAALRAALAQAVAAVGKNGTGSLAPAQAHVARAAAFVQRQMRSARAAADHSTTAAAAGGGGSTGSGGGGDEAKQPPARVAALLEDLQGECKLAFAKAADAKRWGRHFVPSLSFAHRAQRCNNFKDPGVQAYGGRMFAGVRDAADDVFLQLPAPEPSRRRQLEQARKATAAATRRPYVPVQAVNMASYYNYSGGCIAADCLATTMSGASTSTKRVADLRRGDVVATGAVRPDGTLATAVVRCAVDTAVRSGVVEMAVLGASGGLKITPWHPICQQQQQQQQQRQQRWQFPGDAVSGRTEAVRCDHMYTFVLEDSRTGAPATGLLVDGVQCCALGHGVEGDAVLSHAFLGTAKVVDALRRCSGWDAGFVCLRQGDFRRDPATNMITDIVQSAAVDAQ